MMNKNTNIYELTIDDKWHPAHSMKFHNLAMRQVDLISSHKHICISIISIFNKNSSFFWIFCIISNRFLLKIANSLRNVCDAISNHWKFQIFWQIDYFIWIYIVHLFSLCFECCYCNRFPNCIYKESEAWQKHSMKTINISNLLCLVFVRDFNVISKYAITNNRKISIAIYLLNTCASFFLSQHKQSK